MNQNTVPAQAARQPLSAPTDEEIYERLFAAIMEQHLKPGTKLPEDTIAQAFGVSRTRIRTVLQRLSHENLVTIRRNRGAAVARPSIKEARDVLAARRIFESGATELLTPLLTAEAIAGLRALVEEERAARRAGDKTRMLKLSGEFHIRLMRVLDNPTLDGFLHELVSRTLLIIAVYEAPRHSGCRCEDHAKLLDLIETRQVQAASDYMCQHLVEIENSLSLEEVGRKPADLKEILARVGTRNKG